VDPIDTYLEIRRAAAQVEAPIARAAKGIGLRPTQAVALALLARHGPRPISHYSRDLSINLPSATQIADRLEQAGYVQRRYSQTDRRIHELVITDQGREAAAAFLAALDGTTAQQKDGRDGRVQALD
jgi:DNA-binding MarR family transcriptional regulator